MQLQYCLNIGYPRLSNLQELLLGEKLSEQMAQIFFSLDWTFSMQLFIKLEIFIVFSVVTIFVLKYIYSDREYKIMEIKWCRKRRDSSDI